jgi:D-sedoheptulose 7-phosphate isomerase
MEKSNSVENSVTNSDTDSDTDRFFSEHKDLAFLKDPVHEVIHRIVACYQNGGKLLLCGNGGSSADCDHIAGELMKGFKLRRPIPKEHLLKIHSLFPQDSKAYEDALQGALPAISLTSHSALLSAYSNDVGWEMAFAQQVYGYAKAGDVLIAMSTTGNSPNVVHAAQIAKVFELHTIAFTGSGGGKLMEICDITLNCPHNETYRIQEYHMALYHWICEMVEKEMFGNE